MCEAGHDIALHLQAFSMHGAPNSDPLQAAGADPASQPASRPLLKLDPVDSLDVTILIDNSLDALLASGPRAAFPTPMSSRASAPVFTLPDARYYWTDGLVV